MLMPIGHTSVAADLLHYCSSGTVNIYNRNGKKKYVLLPQSQY